MTPTPEAVLHALGSRFGINGPYAARTMMLDELRLSLGHTDPRIGRADYAVAIVDEINGHCPKVVARDAGREASRG